MRTPKAIVWLSPLISVLALVAAGTGLFWQDAGSSFSFTTLRGETVQMYGQGLYRYDSLFTGAGYKGQDATTLFLGIPLLVLLTLLYRRGSPRAGLLLTGVLAYFVYVYVSMAFNAAYNNLSSSTSLSFLPAFSRSCWHSRRLTSRPCPPRS